MTDRRASQRVIIVIRLRKDPSCVSRSTLFQKRRSRLAGLFSLLLLPPPLHPLFSLSFFLSFFFKSSNNPSSDFVSGQSSCLEDSLETLATFAARNRGNVREIKLGWEAKGINAFAKFAESCHCKASSRQALFCNATGCSQSTLLSLRVIQLTLQPFPVTKKSMFFPNAPRALNERCVCKIYNLRKDAKLLAEIYYYTGVVFPSKKRG